MNLKSERWYPYIGGTAAVATAAAWTLRTSWLPPATIKDLFAAIINVAAIAVGFLSAALAILFSISSSRVVRQLKAANRFGFVVGYMMQGIAWAFILALVSGVSILIDPTGPSRHRFTWVIPMWIGVLVTAALTYYRVVRVFKKILLHKDNVEKTATLPDVPEPTQYCPVN